MLRKILLTTIAAIVVNVAIINLASAVTITGGPGTEVTNILGPNFFFDTASPGGGDFTVNQPNVATFDRDFGTLFSGSLGSQVSITGIGWASLNGRASLDLTSAMVSFTYLGADGVFGGGDDLLIGSATDSFVLPAEGAVNGEYVWAFDSPIVGDIDGLNSFFRIAITPSNDASNGSLSFKTTSGTLASAVKLSVAGSSIALGAATAEWANAASGSWNTPGNWSTGEVPGVAPNAGAAVVFGGSIAAASTVTLDVNVEVGNVTLNSANAYTIAGTSTLTLSGAGEISADGAFHTINAPIGGSVGLTKEGTGTLSLGGNNTYTGTTTINDGDLRVSTTAAIPASSAVDIAAAGDLIFLGDGVGGGYSGTFTNTVTGAGRVVTGNLLTTEVVTLGASLAGHTGQLVVNGGTARVTNLAAFGASTGTVDQTVVGGGTTNFGTLLLEGDLNVAGETLFVGGRAAAVGPSVSSIGNNTWSGPITGGTGGTDFEFESRSGLFTLAGTITMNDNGDRNIVLSGASNGRVTSSFANNLIGNGQNDNIRVTKTGTGTWTIRPTADPFVSTATLYAGGTTVAQGTLVVENDGTGFNSLAGNTHIAAGAFLNTTSFTGLGYFIAPGTTLSGAGTISTSTFNVLSDNVVSPGDSVGTLNVTGNLALGAVISGPETGSLNFELGSVTTVGGGVNDLVTVSGNLTLSGGTFGVNITPVAGSLATGPYRLIDANGGSGGTTTFAPANFTSLNGDALNTRLTGAVTRSGADVVANFTGAVQNATWTGSESNAWDVATSNNWNTSDNQFRDLDNVIFNDTAATTVVSVAANVSPGSVTFSNTAAKSYTVAGAGAIVTGGAVNVTGGGKAIIANTGGNQLGNVNLTSGTLSIASTTASSGSLSGTGTLELNGGNFDVSGNSTGTLAVTSQTVSGGGTVTGNVTTTSASTIRVGGIGAGTPFRTAGLQLNYDAARDIAGDNQWNDAEANAGFVDLVFTETTAATPVPASPVAASDATFQNLTLAYDTSGIGVVSPGSQNGYFDARGQQNGSFEVVFHVSDLNAGAGQVLLDIGGTRGVSLTLNDNQLFAAVNGDGSTAAIGTAVTTGWHQAVIVVNQNGPNDAMNDAFRLYLNGALVDTALTGLNIDDWAGSNPWGLSRTDGQTVVDPLGMADEAITTPLNFHGQIAVKRYYQAALVQGDVDQNYNALLDPTPLVLRDTLNIAGDFSLSNSASLEIDIFGAANNDLLSVTGLATLAGEIDISLVNAFAPLAGQTFTILSAAGGIVDAGLSLVGDGNFSFSIVNGTDLVLSLGNLGDYNGDGLVDAADYTVWRDTLGATGVGLAADGDGDGTVNAADYTLWRSNFGNNYNAASLGGVGSGAVPEPTSLALVVLGALAAGMIVRRN